MMQNEDRFNGRTFLFDATALFVLSLLGVIVGALLFNGIAYGERSHGQHGQQGYLRDDQPITVGMVRSGQVAGVVLLESPPRQPTRGGSRLCLDLLRDVAHVAANAIEAENLSGPVLLARTMTRSFGMFPSHPMAPSSHRLQFYYEQQLSYDRAIVEWYAADERCRERVRQKAKIISQHYKIPNEWFRGIEGSPDDPWRQVNEEYQHYMNTVNDVLKLVGLPQERW